MKKILVTSTWLLCDQFFWKLKWKCQLLSSVQFSWVAQLCLNLCDPMDYIAHQAPISMEFSRQEYCSGVAIPLQGIFPTQGLKLGLLHCRQILYCLSHRGSPVLLLLTIKTSVLSWEILWVSFYSQENSHLGRHIFY